MDGAIRAFNRPPVAASKSCNLSRLLPGHQKNYSAFIDCCQWLRIKQLALKPTSFSRSKNLRRLTVQAKDNHYHTLGIQRHATKLEVKQAYRNLARKHHPDVSKLLGAEQRFCDIKAAYEVLGDDDKRGAYDKSLRETASATLTYRQSPNPSHPNPARPTPAARASARRSTSSPYRRAGDYRTGLRNHRPMYAARAEPLKPRDQGFWEQGMTQQPLRGDWEAPTGAGVSGRPHPSVEYPLFQNSQHRPSANGSGDYSRQRRQSMADRQQPWHRKTSIDLKSILFLTWVGTVLWSVYGASATLTFLATSLVLAGDTSVGYKAAGIGAWGIGGRAGLVIALALHIVVKLVGNLGQGTVGVLTLVLCLGGRIRTMIPIPTAAVVLLALKCLALQQRWDDLE